MTEQQTRQLVIQAERGSKESSTEAMRKLRAAFPDAKYHWCAEWDYMVIHKDSKEFSCCTCKL